MYRLTFLLGFFFAWTSCEIVVIKKQKDKIYSGHVLFTVAKPMWSLCAQFCSRVQLCKSINFIAWNKTCQLNDAEPGESKFGLIESTGNSFVAASTFPKQLAGQCKGNDCKWNEACMPQGPDYYCVPLPIKLFESCTREGFLVSQFKETGQSTTHECDSTFQCGAAAGVDGIKTPNNMFHTEMEREPFWWVNLGQVYMVQKVVSTNRIDKYETTKVDLGIEQMSYRLLQFVVYSHAYYIRMFVVRRLTKMLIHVGKSLDTSHMELCGQFIGPAVIGQVIVTPCNTLPGGQIVKLTSVNTVPEYFHLVEVEVYGC